LYETLAHDLVKLGAEKQCRVLLIAGDVLQSAILPPMTINAAKRFMEVLAAGFEHVIVIPGQHDLDVKIEQGTVDHSIIAPIADSVTYHAEPAFGTIEVAGHAPLTYHAVPWTPSSAPAFGDADVYIGHGMVAGSKDPYGYVFNRGFSRDDLWRYKFSLIGDIHEPQHFVDPATQHAILVPGQPIQVNFSSGFPTGAWVVDWRGDAPLLEFCPTTGFEHAADYHYFLDTVPPALRKFPNVHSRIKKEKAAKRNKGEAEDVADDTRPLIEVVREKAATLQLQDPEWALEQLKQAYEAVKAGVERAVPKRCRVLSLEVANFQSVGAEGVVIDFASISDSTLLISGDNGTGKTVLGEALFWGVTGCLTKEVPVAEISCDYGDGPAVCRVGLLVEDVEYTVVRSRKAGQLMKLYQGEEDITSNDPQAQLYNIIGYQEKDIRNLVYFSLNDLTLFTNLTVTEQLAVVADLVDLGALDSMAENISAEATRIAGLHTTLSSEQRYLSTRQGQLTDQITELESQNAINGTIDVALVTSKLQQAVAQRNKVSAEIEAKRIVRQEAQTRLNALTEDADADRLVQQRLAAAKTTLADVTERRKTAKANNCPTCHQQLQDMTLLTELTNEMMTAQSRVTALLACKPKLNETALLDAEGVISVANAELEQLRTTLVQLDGRVQTATQNIAAAQQSGDGEARLRALRDELALLVPQLNPAQLATYEVQLTDLKLLGRLLVRNNRSPVYSALLRGTYLKLLAGVNEGLASVEHPYRLSLSDDYQLRVFTGEGAPRSVKRLSGGERRLLDYAMLVGLSRHYSDTFGAGPALGIRLFDEVFVYLSDRNMQLAHAMLQELDGLNIVISNDEKLKGLFESHIRATLNPNRTSRYTFNLK
jgi:DNA repair exonuclease SbcCD nuclease subunit